MFFNWNGYRRCCWKHTSLTKCTDSAARLKICTSDSVCPAADSLTLGPQEQKLDIFSNEAPMFYKISVSNKIFKVQLNHLLYFFIDPMFTKIKFLFLIFPQDDIWVKVKLNFTCKTRSFTKLCFHLLFRHRSPIHSNYSCFSISYSNFNAILYR
jgi:hypothetical protein